MEVAQEKMHRLKDLYVWGLSIAGVCKGWRCKAAGGMCYKKFTVK